MASLNEICTALAKTIQNYSTQPVFVYDTPARMVSFPAIMIEPDVGDYRKSMGRTTQWELRVFVLCAGNEMSLSIKQLNDMIDGWGDNSIRRIVHEHSDLGLNDTDATATEVTSYGGSFDSASIKAVGAIIMVRVITDPSA